jgi:hypothetical protein
MQHRRHTPVIMNLLHKPRLVVSFTDYDCLSDTTDAASDTDSCASSLNHTQCTGVLSQAKNVGSALPVRIPDTSTCDIERNVKIYMETACLRDWQMYCRMSARGASLLRPTPDEETALDAVHAQMQEVCKAAEVCSAQTDELVFGIEL